MVNIPAAVQKGILMQNKFDTKKLSSLAMLSAMALALAAVAKIFPPIVSVPGLSLRYDPKDIIIVISGFLYGPLPAFLVSLVVSLIEMVTVSENGAIGLLMNVISSCAFACLAAFVYKYKRTIVGAVCGLVAGWLFTTLVMLLWNYLITPIYTGAPRGVVAGMLIPVFLPFNLIKGGLNASMALLIYKPVRAALIKSKLMPKPMNNKRGRVNVGAIIASLFVIATCVLCILVINNLI